MTNRSFKVYVVRTSPAYAFVPHPQFRGLYIRTDQCVAYAACPLCGAAIGVPCSGSYGYHVATHVVRHRADKGAVDGRYVVKDAEATEIDLAKFAARAGNG
jgi:hypothetical protein